MRKYIRGSATTKRLKSTDVFDVLKYYNRSQGTVGNGFDSCLTIYQYNYILFLYFIKIKFFHHLCDDKDFCLENCTES